MRGKRILVFAAIALLLTGQFSPACGQDVKGLIRSIDEQQRKIETITALFVQKKETSLVKMPLLSSGLVRFKRPDLIHWNYAEPEPMEVAISGKGIWIYHPGSLQAEKYYLGRNKRMTQSLEPLLAIFQKTFHQLSDDYAIIYGGLETEHIHHFSLHPRDEKVRKFLSRVDLWIDKTSGAIIRFKMVEANGDRLNLEFKNLQINPPLTDDDLKIKIPPSVRVWEQSTP
ncbi:MAG: outer membrane lipoprotein carrier protein LolA [Proteobacteria bacterium]|nr:outer membrane lipoprotein carrier protein LolA [Pseudomonadota bacterium]